MLANGIISPKTVETVPAGKHKRWKREEKKEEEKEEEEDVYTPSEEEESKGEESGCEVGVTMDIRVVLSTIEN